MSLKVIGIMDPILILLIARWSITIHHSLKSQNICSMRTIMIWNPGNIKFNSCIHTEIQNILLEKHDFWISLAICVDFF